MNEKIFVLVVQNFCLYLMENLLNFIALIKSENHLKEYNVKR